MTYVSVAEQRLAAMRRAMLDTADAHDMPITIRHLTVLAEAVTSTLYPTAGRPDPVLGIGRRTHLKRTGQALSDVELVILRYVINGAINPEIASLVGCSVDTVKAHLKRIYAKLGARDRTHAVALYCTSDAYRDGDVPVPELRA